MDSSLELIHDQQDILPPLPCQNLYRPTSKSPNPSRNRNSYPKSNRFFSKSGTSIVNKKDVSDIASVSTYDVSTDISYINTPASRSTATPRTVLPDDTTTPRLVFFKGDYQFSPPVRQEVVEVPGLDLSVLRISSTDKTNIIEENNISGRDQFLMSSEYVDHDIINEELSEQEEDLSDILPVRNIIINDDFIDKRLVEEENNIYYVDTSLFHEDITKMKGFAPSSSSSGPRPVYISIQNQNNEILSPSTQNKSHYIEGLLFADPPTGTEDNNENQVGISTKSVQFVEGNNNEDDELEKSREGKLLHDPAWSSTGGGQEEFQIKGGNRVTARWGKLKDQFKAGALKRVKAKDDEEDLKNKAKDDEEEQNGTGVFDSVGPGIGKAARKSVVAIRQELSKLPNVSKMKARKESQIEIKEQKFQRGMNKEEIQKETMSSLSERRKELRKAMDKILSRKEDRKDILAILQSQPDAVIYDGTNEALESASIKSITSDMEDGIIQIRSLLSLKAPRQPGPFLAQEYLPHQEDKINNLLHNLTPPVNTSGGVISSGNVSKESSPDSSPPRPERKSLIKPAGAIWAVSMISNEVTKKQPDPKVVDLLEVSEEKRQVLEPRRFYSREEALENKPEPRDGKFLQILKDEHVGVTGSI